MLKTLQSFLQEHSYQGDRAGLPPSPREVLRHFLAIVWSQSPWYFQTIV